MKTGLWAKPFQVGLSLSSRLSGPNRVHPKLRAVHPLRKSFNQGIRHSPSWRWRARKVKKDSPAAPDDEAQGLLANDSAPQAVPQKRFGPHPPPPSHRAKTLRGSRPRPCAFSTRHPAAPAGPPTCVPSPVSQRRRRPPTCPVTAAEAADPGPARPPTPGGSGSVGCPAARSAAGRAVTARGSSGTAAEGPGPWLEIAGPRDAWAAGPTAPPPRAPTTSARRSRGLRKPPGSHRKHTSQTLNTTGSRKCSRLALGGGARELRGGSCAAISRDGARLRKPEALG